MSSEMLTAHSFTTKLFHFTEFESFLVKMIHEELISESFLLL